MTLTLENLILSAAVVAGAMFVGREMRQGTEDLALEYRQQLKQALPKPKDAVPHKPTVPPEVVDFSSDYSFALLP